MRRDPVDLFGSVENELKRGFVVLVVDDSSEEPYLPRGILPVLRAFRQELDVSLKEIQLCLLVNELLLFLEGDMFVFFLLLADLAFEHWYG